MTHGSLFSGIGGFDLAAQWAGIKNIFQVEKDEFCQKVLQKNFPDTDKYLDICEFNGAKYNGTVDIISGGFPCQPFSIAGRMQSTNDERFLWGEMFRVIKEVKPKWVIAENVQGLVNISDGLVLESLFTDMENEGYETQAYIIPAISKNAPHKRNRIWIVSTLANSSSVRDTRHELQSGKSKKIGQRWPSNETYSDSHWDRHWHEVATEFCRVDDGIPQRLDRVKSLGNAIVPQIAYEIFRIIKLINGVL